MTDSLKSLLRPLRNTILSSASPKETPRQTPREREVERNLARIKGFTYLKSMDELLRWDESLEDPIQRSNIPLLPRSSTEEGGKAKTMVVHDFGSAYHEYEANNACIGVEEEAFSLGGGGEMQSIEIFCYFAHYLVSAPPASWVNLCHRNGVKVLGTFIIEPQTPGEEVGRILLERDEDGAFIVVKKLGEIARWIGFEGWIVNIEGVFHDEVWNLDLMTGFLKELRESGIVVWYDALTTSNKITHQNALTPSNLPLVLAAGHLLTNYAWNPSKISSSISLASQHGLDPQNIFFGIDIWAQNRPRSFWHPRITWPIFDGGGTNTGFAVTKCAEIGVGAGLFAPGWCWEHFGSTSDRIAVEGAIWRGEKLNMDMRCDCKGGFWERGDVHRTEKYREFPIVKSARKHVAGTDSGFWTDFEKAVVSHDDGLDEFYGGHHMHAQLGAQGIMPLAVENEEDRKIWWEIFDERPSKLTIIAAKSSHEDLRQRYLKLYELGVRVEEGTKLVVRYRGPKSEAPIAAGFLIKFHSSSGESQKFVQLPAENRYDYPFLKTFSHSLAPIIASNAQIIEIGVAVVGDLSDEQEILEISELTIGAPLFFMVNKSEILATNIKITVVGEEEWRHGRLMWQLKGLPEKKSEWWNERTGPVAYFDVGIDGIVHGRAYGLEFVLPDSVMEHWQSRGVSVQLTGVLFGGARLAKIQVLLKGRTG